MNIQEEQDRCGNACVREVLSIKFRSKNFYLEEFQSPLSDFSQMRKELSDRGLAFTSYEVDSLENLKKKLPAICQIVQGGKTHFIVLKKITRTNVLIGDPQFGDYVMKIAEFHEIFQKKALAFEGVLRKEKRREESLFNGLEKTIYLLIFIAMSACSVLFMMYLSREDGFVYALFFALAMILITIVQFIVNFQVKARIEKQYLLPYMAEFKVETDFLKLMKMVQLKIRKMSSLVSFATVTVAFASLLLFSSPYMSFIFVFTIMFALLKRPLFREQNRANRDASLNEQAYLQSLKKNETASFFKASKIASNYLKKKVFTQMIELFAYIILILAELYITQTFQFGYFFYYLCIALALSEIFSKLLSALGKDDEYCIELHTLSHSFREFLILQKRSIAYNNKLKRGLKRDGEKNT